MEAEHAKLVIEHQKKEFEFQKIAHKRWKVTTDAWNQSAKSAMDYGRQAISMILLINGGAAVAILTKIGAPSLLAGQSSVNLGLALVLYAIGCAAAAGAAGLSYLSQAGFTADRSKPGEVFRSFAVAFWIAGLGLFLGGSWIASRAI